MANEKFLTPEELAERYRGRVQVKTLANWRCAGTGPAYKKIGMRILYALSDVESWEVAQHRSAAATPAKAAGR